MGKTKKFFLSPALYWRDFLLKRYPLTVGPTKNKSRLYKKPDFYIVHSHAVGQTSFRRCLHILGMPAVQFHDWNSKNRISHGQKISGCLRDLSTLKKKNKYAGISVDRYIPYGQKLLFSEYVPVYLLVRDPISIIKSYLNHKIACSIVENYQHNWDTYKNSFDYKVNFITQVISCPHVFRFSSALNTVANPSDIKVIDTTDISRENICDTMTGIANQFGIETNDSMKNNFLKTFLPAQQLFSPPHILIHRGKDSIKLQIIPNSSYDNCSIDCFKIRTISGNGREYRLGVIDNHIDDTLIDAIISCNLDEIMHYSNFCIDRFNMIASIYNKSIVSEEDVMAIIRRDPVLMDDFNRVMDKELEVIERLRPSLIDTWTYLKQIRG